MSVVDLLELRRSDNAMKIIPWKLPLRAGWPRALILNKLTFANGALAVVVQEEEAELLWRIEFAPVQAIRTTTEECAGQLLGQLPEQGGLFEVLESPWIKSLGDAQFLAKAHHYIVCCYDEVIEVAAWEGKAAPAEVEQATATRRS